MRPASRAACRIRRSATTAACMSAHPHEIHRSNRAGWLRAAVLGANDGIVSIASLIVGFAAAGGDRHSMLLAGVAGLVGGALSMAAGEYVSVSSQADAENADLAIERRSLRRSPEAELHELADLYRRRGLGPELARRVAEELSAHDALAAHARDELGITHERRARPLQAAAASAAAFASGAALPLAVALCAPLAGMGATITASSLLALAVLGAAAAHAGGAPMLRGAARVVFWSALAMVATATIGRLFGT